MEVHYLPILNEIRKPSYAENLAHRKPTAIAMTGRTLTILPTPAKAGGTRKLTNTPAARGAGSRPALLRACDHVEDQGLLSHSSYTLRC